MTARINHSYHSFSKQQVKGSLRDLPTNTTLTEAAPKPSLHLVSQEGQLQVHTTTYRGSFSVVLSEALRAAGLGSRVMVVQFLKGGVHQGPEGSTWLCGRLEWLRPAISECLPQSIPNTEKYSPLESSRQAILEIWQTCKEYLLKGGLDQLVLDEIGLAIALGYIPEAEVLATLEKRPGYMDVILTGPSIPSPIMDMADQITELRCGF